MATPRKKVPGQVLDILRSSVRGKIHQPNLAELAQHFFDLAGGERNVAKMLLNQYNHPDCPSSIKTKIMQFMLQHLRWVNEKSGNIDELGNLTEEDLFRELDNHIRVVAQTAHQKSLEKKAEKEADGLERRSAESA